MVAQDAFAGDFTTKVVDWLTEGGDLIQKASVFGVEHGHNVFRDIDNFVHQVEYDTATHYMKYSELKNNSTFGHLYNADFVSKSFDPIIAINASTKDMTNISIYDVTPIPVGYNKSTDNILVDVIPQNIRAKLKGINLNNDEIGTRQLMSGLLLNQMMDADSKVSVENVKFIELRKSKSIDHTIDPIAMTNTIRTIGQEESFMNAIANEKMKSIFKNPKHTAKTDYFETLKSFYRDYSVEEEWQFGLRAMLENKTLTPKENYSILSLRQKAIQKGRDETKASKFTYDQIKELKYLSGAIFQVRKSLSHDSQTNPFTGLTKFDKMVFNASSVGDEYSQAMRNLVYESSGTMVELIGREKKLLN